LDVAAVIHHITTNAALLLLLLLPARCKLHLNVAAINHHHPCC
jgi:hypothetical protein